MNVLNGAPAILVAEDEGPLRDIIRDLLVWKGYSVDAVGDGMSALLRTRLRRYDAVVSDVCLPGATGIELAGRLARLHRPPVLILMTAYPEWHTKAERTQAAAVLRKPLDLRELLKLLASRVYPPCSLR